MMTCNVVHPLALVIAGLLASGAACADSITPCRRAVDASIVQADAVDRFRALAERRARDYDRAQDIRPDQLLVLLDVAERTGYSLGQLLATGEHESAHTWNDFVRPPLNDGRVGVATGVWQFQPATFARLLQLHGEELLALTEADQAAGWRRLDLGFGPFCDHYVRLLIGDAIDGLRGADDAELMLLRHGFTALALSKFLLSKTSGARSPVEDYLFHFLGAGEGRRILALARGDARNTRTVKPKPPEPLEPAGQGIVSRDGLGSAPSRNDNLPPRPALVLDVLPAYYRSLVAQGPAPVGAQPRVISGLGAAPSAAPAWPAPHGYDYDSPVVTGNLGMFYRDGAERSDPYTWAEFLDHLARRVKADRQPRLVRAKYGVGFAMNGGDLPRWAFRPDKPGKPMTLRLDDGRSLQLPQAQITAPLDGRETGDYQRRLAAVIAFGEAEPSKVLSDAAVAALYRLGLLWPDAGDRAPTLDETMSALATDMGPGWGAIVRSDQPRVRDALQAFRALVGKAPPDDPDQSGLLLPAERVALEVYGRRIDRLLAEEQTNAAGD